MREVRVSLAISTGAKQSLITIEDNEQARNILRTIAEKYPEYAYQVNLAQINLDDYESVFDAAYDYQFLEEN